MPATTAASTWYTINCPANTYGNDVKVRQPAATYLHFADIEVYGYKCTYSTRVSVSKYGKIQTTNSGSIASTEIKPGFHQTKTANAEGSNASWGFMKINYSNAD